MSIEQNIFNQLNPAATMSEATQYNDNGQIAADLAKGMGNCSFEYPGLIVSPTKDSGIICSIKVDINEDDLEVVESNNVVYVYLRADKIDFEILGQDEMVANSLALNMRQMIETATSFRPITKKCWRDDQKLYLLKMNRNSGLIGRFEQSTGTFKNQEINYRSSNDVEIGQDMLTKDYLQQYLSEELHEVFTPLDPMYQPSIDAKLNNEQVKRFEVRR